MKTNFLTYLSALLLLAGSFAVNYNGRIYNSPCIELYKYCNQPPTHYCHIKGLMIKLKLNLMCVCPLNRCLCNEKNIIQNVENNKKFDVFKKELENHLDRHEYKFLDPKKSLAFWEQIWRAPEKLIGSIRGLQKMIIPF